MKIRIRANSIRFRLGQEEIEMLRRGEIVQEQLSIGPDLRFSWSVRIGLAGSEPSIGAEADQVHVTVPPLDWLNDESKEGYRTSIESSPGYHVRIAVERDYRCLQPRDPVEDRDSFPHPGKRDDRP